MRRLSACLGVESALVTHFLKVAGWSSHSRRVLGQRVWDLLPGCAACLGSYNESVARTMASNYKPDGGELRVWFCITGLGVGETFSFDIVRDIV
jgi:hypothetical protein